MLLQVCMFAVGCVERVFNEVSILLTGTAIKPFVAAIVNASASAQGCESIMINVRFVFIFAENMF